MLFDVLLEIADQAFQVVDVEINVVRDALRGLGFVQSVGENLPGHVQDGLAVHLQQPPVGVPGESFVAADLREPLDAGVVQSDVEDRFHHAGHGELGPGPHADQQRVVSIAQLAAEPVLQLPQRGGDLDPQLGRVPGPGGGTPGRRRW